MNKKILIASLGALCALSACGGSPTGPTDPGVTPLSMTRFLAFGDSVTEGKLSNGTLSVSYPDHLRQHLSAAYPLQAFTVVGAGHGGEIVLSSLSRFTSLLDAHQPQAVLIMHGVNDLNGYDVVGAANGIRALVLEAQARHLRVFVATLPPLGAPSGVAGSAEELNLHIRTMTGVIVVDIAAGWRVDLMGVDGIHPTAAGHARIAELFFAAIQAAR